MSSDLEDRLTAAAPRPSRRLNFERVQAKTRALRRRRQAAVGGVLGLAGVCTVAVVQLLAGGAPVEVGPDPVRPSPTATVPSPAATTERTELDCPAAADQVADRWVNPPDGAGGAPELVSARSGSVAEAVAWRSRTIPTEEGGLPPITMEPPEFIAEAPQDATVWACVYWAPQGFSVSTDGPPLRYLIVAAVEGGEAQMLEAHPDPPTGQELGPNAGPETTLPDWHTPAPAATCFLSGDVISIDAGPDGNEWEITVKPDQAVTIEATVDVPASLHLDRLQWEITPEGPSRAYQGGPLGEPGAPVIWWTIAASDLGPGQHTLDITWDATDREGSVVPAGRYHLTGVAQARPTDPSGAPCAHAETATIGAGVGYLAVP